MQIELTIGGQRIPQWLPRAALTVVYGLCAVMAALPQTGTVCALLMLVCICVLFFYDDFYCAAPVFLFFTEQLTLGANMPIFRLYAYLLIIHFFLWDARRTTMSVRYIPVILVLLLYGIFALPGVNVSSSVRLYELRGTEPPPVMMIQAKFVWNYAVNVLYTILLAMRLQNDRNTLEKFLNGMVALMAVSGVYGLRSGNSYAYSLAANAEVTRQRASFNDPNYASFFINIAVFLTLILPRFRSWKWKIPLLVFFYYLLLAAGSMTGFLLNIAGMAVLLVIYYRRHAVLAVTAAALIVGGCTAVVRFVPAVYRSAPVQSMVNRLVYQFGEAEDDDYDRLTSGRAGQWDMYGEYFMKQPFGKQLFGGNIVMTSSLDPYFEENFKYGPHQAYLGMLLDVGAAGLLILLSAFAFKSCGALIQGVKKKDELALALAMLSFVWLFYGFALDYFFDIRFMLFYFL